MNSVTERVRARIRARHAARAAAPTDTPAEVPYRELQAQAKERGIAANQSREELEAALEAGDE